jgi:ubiquitin carboxyl-terminal hydrolase 34
VRTDLIFYRFLSAYVRLCSFLFLADIHLLSQPRHEEIYPLALLSQRHIRSLHNMFREKAPVFQVLLKEYAVDMRDILSRLKRDFLKASGAQNLLDLADTVFHQVPLNSQNQFATFTSQLLSVLGWTVYEGAGTHIDRAKFYRNVLLFIQRYDTDLQDPSKPIDANAARDLVQCYSTLIQELCQWDDEIAAELVGSLLDFGNPDSPTSSSSVAEQCGSSSNDYLQDATCFPALAANAWRFKILRKYIVKGNMNLRVMSIATMDAALVDIWREFSNILPSCQHPVMQYLADFLLQGQVVDYIVSVDSHPQLISRSGNIVGFLVVTHRWSDDQADAVWRTVATSPDPRVVTATISMLRNIIALMKPPAHLYFCMKMHDLPIDRYTMDILRFLRDLTEKLKNSPEPIDFDERGPTSRPWNVCIRMLRDTAPSRDADKNLLDLHMEANHQFQSWIGTIPMDQRYEIYCDCAQHIAQRTSKATGSIRVVCFLISSLQPGDNVFFSENQALIQSILEETPAFVKMEKEAGLYQYQPQALLCRLELLRLTILHPAMTVPADLYHTLWDHIVGEHALTNDARDLAWAQLTDASKISPDNDFCQQLVSSYITTIHANYYTPGLFEFVANYKFPIIRRKIATEHGEDSLLQIPGADLLWPMVLSSPTGTIEDRAARLLAARYVEIVDTEGIMLSEVEDAHIALVEQCLQELKSAVKTLQRQPLGKLETTTSDFSATRDLPQTTEVRIGRILLFQKLLLECIRRKPDFNRGRRADSKVEAMESEISFGDAVTVRYQYGNERQLVTMPSDNTLEDLERRLCSATGYTKVNLFARGQRLKPTEQRSLRLSEIDFGGQVIVQKAEGAETTNSTSGPVGGVSVFETAIVKHFDELFSWMDSDDLRSQLLFDFLSSFPARGTFADSVMRTDISSEDLFPAGKVFQARYAAQDLQAKLREQIRNSTIKETFLSKAIHHLERALLKISAIDDSKPSGQELQLVAVLVKVLLEFLRERPSLDISNSYFPDGAPLVDRLMRILMVALGQPELATLAQDSYATILEASLHSRAVWEAFVRHIEVNHVHQSLLLVHPEQVIREAVAQKIASICGGDLPSTCPITRAETASCFWVLLSAIIPEAARYPRQSQQLFEIAEHVFRTNDEYDRNEESLRLLLAQWSNLLLSHKHNQFPGREETDHVVLGLTKLLLGCVVSLKSFKKPVNAGPLMAEVFKKYIFTLR